MRKTLPLAQSAPTVLRAAGAALREMARTVNAQVREHVLMPVGIHVMSPGGGLLPKASVDRDRLMGHRSTRKYLSILEAGLGARKPRRAAEPGAPAGG